MSVFVDCSGWRLLQGPHRLYESKKETQETHHSVHHVQKAPNSPSSSFQILVFYASLMCHVQCFSCKKEDLGIMGYSVMLQWEVLTSFLLTT